MLAGHTQVTRHERHNKRIAGFDAADMQVLIALAWLALCASYRTRSSARSPRPSTGILSMRVASRLSTPG